jgi:hypothetical protein
MDMMGKEALGVAQKAKHHFNHVMQALGFGFGQH